MRNTGQIKNTLWVMVLLANSQAALSEDHRQVEASGRQQAEARMIEDTVRLQQLKTPEYVIPGFQAGQSRLLEPGAPTPGLPLGISMSDAERVEDEERLLEPPEVLANDNPVQRSGWASIGIADQHAENMDSRRILQVMARYLASEQWYLLAGIEYGLLSDQPVRRSDGVAVVAANTTTITAYAGLGVPLLKGIVKPIGSHYVPWQVGVEGVLGEQFMGNLSGRYTGLGLNMSLLMDRFWMGSDWRWYAVDDDALKAAGVHQGTQISLSAGVYF